MIDGTTLEEQVEAGEGEDISEREHIKSVARIFTEVDELSLRTELRELLNPENEQLTPGVVSEIGQQFNAMLASDQLTKGEYEELDTLMKTLLSGSPEDKTLAREKLSKFVTHKEKEFMQPKLKKEG